MQDNAKAMVLASFVADSLALGVHWIYDTAVINNDFGRVESLRQPKENSYHPTKEKGDFTHYGDQTLVLLDSVSAGKGFELEQFARSWQDFFDGYNGYFDRATKDTLKNFAAGKSPSESGSRSSELGGTSRIAPLAYRYRENPDTLTAAARAQTAMTHNNQEVLESSEFFAGVVSKVLQGSAPVAAVKASLPDGRLGRLVQDGLESSGLETRKAIKGFGQMCDIAAGLPGVIHLIARYENNLKEALVENVMAGGDSAARGMLVGMVLGAHQGPAAIPSDWLAELKSHQQISELLQIIDAA
jgi:ADP-ribosylglycohydrolase